MTMLLVLLLVAGGLSLVFSGWGLFGALLVVAGIWISNHAKGDPVEDLLALLFGLLLVLGVVVLVIEKVT